MISLKQEHLSTIEQYKLHQMCSLLYWIADKLNEDHDNPKSKLGVTTFLRHDVWQLPDTEKLELARTLCDRIEAKLMEEAK